jgi:hypothetical protein
MEDDEMEEGIQSVETMSRCYNNSLMAWLSPFF